MSIAALLDRRLILVTGKGGVGKSTCAIALALAAARSGKRTLLIELSARAVSSDFLDTETPGHTPRVMAPERFPTLWVAHLDAHKSLQEYLVEHLHIPRLVKIATENRILSRLWQAAPSVNEVSLLNTLYQHERARDDTGAPLYDIVIVDMPATGHALTMLGVPRGAVSMIRVGTLAERARTIDLLLHDRAKVAVAIVTLPEELPINESIQLADDMQRKLEMEPSHVLVNGILPELLEADERVLFDRIAQTVEAGPGRNLIETASRDADRRRIQALRIVELRARVRAEFIEIAFMARHGFGLVNAVADFFLQPA